LIQELDRSGMKTTCTNAGELLGRPTFEDGDIHLRKREFGGQHQTGGPAAHDHDIVLWKRRPSVRSFRGILVAGAATWTWLGSSVVIS
jgi:hypothetical protein